MRKFYMGKVLRPKGLDGTVKLSFETDSFDSLSSMKTIFLDESAYDVERIYMHNGFVYAKLKGVEKIEDAQNLVGAKVEIEKDENTLTEGEFFLEDLVGSVVLLDDGKLYGKLIESNFYGATEIFTIKSRTGIVLVPFIEGLITNFDKNKKEIVLNKKVLEELV